MAMVTPREETVYMAKLADEAERYEEMVKLMKHVTALAAAEGDDLTAEERDILSAAYKRQIDVRRASWRMVSCIEQGEEIRGGENHVASIRDFRAKIESELSSICEAVLRLLDDQLLPSASAAESRVFYLKMKGDYHRYLAEIKKATDREEAVKSTLAAYSSAQDIALAELAPAHPVRLGLALNFSVFYFEILNSLEQARNLANEAISAALPAIDDLDDQTYKDTSPIMDRLGDNFTLWNSRMKSLIADDGKDMTSKQQVE